MELQQLRYFLAVADRESVTEAAAAVPISPGSLTKAVQALERELGVKLFVRTGRRIRLSDAGRDLQLKARELILLEEQARLDVGGAQQPSRLLLSGEEALLGAFAVPWIGELAGRFPGLRFELLANDPDQLFPGLRRGEIHVAFTTLPVPSDLDAQVLGGVHFVTCVGSGHALYRRRRPMAIEELLEFDFVVPAIPVLGVVDPLQAEDGWRDDAFPRRVLVKAASLHQLLAVVEAGTAVAYLPDYLATALGLRVVAVSGCEYECRQPVHRVIAPRIAPRWLLTEVLRSNEVS